MLSETETKKQIKRLMLLPFRPTEREESAELQREYRRVLSRCLSDQHLVAVVDYVIDSSVRCPPPADLARALDVVAPPEKAKAPMGCEVCKGTGWEHFEQTAYTMAGNYTADYCRFCSCERGQWMKKSEEQRAEKRNEKSGRL